MINHVKKSITLVSISASNSYRFQQNTLYNSTDNCTENLHKNHICLNGHGGTFCNVINTYSKLQLFCKLRQCSWACFSKEVWSLQEVFHVYLNKFENAVSHLFLVILGYDGLPWVSLISRNTQSSRK